MARRSGCTSRPSACATRLIRLGLTASGALQVRGSTAVAGWYTGSPRPGEPGGAVIAGHIDSIRGSGAFFRLRLMHQGERVFAPAGSAVWPAVFRVNAACILT